MLAAREQTACQPVQWSGKPFRIDVDYFRPSERSTSSLQHGTITDVRHKCNRCSCGRKTPVPLPADLGNRTEARAALIGREQNMGRCGQTEIASRSGRAGAPATTLPAG